VRGEPAAKLHREPLQSGGPQEQRIEVEPEIAVVAGLQQEVPAPGREQADDLLFERALRGHRERLCGADLHQLF
jgi:hypothetical protein